MFDQSAHSKMSPVPPSLNRIAPLTDRQVVVLMDNDAAGDAAAAKAHTVLAAAGVDQPVTLVPLPVKDAAQLLQEQGPDALRRSLADRRPLADLVVDRVEKLHHARWGRYDQQTPSPEARLNILWAAAPIVAVMPGRNNTGRTFG